MYLSKWDGAAFWTEGVHDHYGDGRNMMIFPSSHYCLIAVQSYYSARAHARNLEGTRWNNDKNKENANSNDNDVDHDNDNDCNTDRDNHIHANATTTMAGARIAS